MGHPCAPLITTLATLLRKNYAPPRFLQAFQKDQDLADQLAKAAEKMAEVKAKVAVIGEA